MSISDGEVAELYERYGPMVLRRCMQLLKSFKQAEDATQDVFVRFLQNRNRLDSTYPSSLLYTMATNLCLNRIRDGKRRGEVREDELLLHIASAENLDRQLEAKSLLDWLFKKHPVSTRTIAVLHLVDGMTLEETAQEVGLSVSGVRKRLRSLRENLPREIEFPREGVS